MKSLLLLIVLLSILHITNSAYCNGKPGAYHNNTNPIWDDQPRLLKTVENGKMYEIGDPKYNTTMKLLHVYGSTYDMGWAQGELLGQTIIDFLDGVWTYLEKEGTDALPKWVPDWLKLDLVNFGGSAALDLTYLVTYKYTTKAYYTEMMAMVEAVGRPDMFAKARRIHMLGELTKGGCSMLGAWGKATKSGETIQLRALDWDIDGPFRKNPSVTVYHPNTPEAGNTWANIGFTGWLGVLSGINEYQMAVSEIGVSYPDSTFGKESRIGNPFTFVLRDVLQYDKNLLESVNRMQSEHRTCNLILGVGDGKPSVGTFRAFQYSHSVANVISDTNLMPKNDTWHPQIENTVYFGMDWLCPPFHQRFSELLKQNYGQIDANLMISSIIPSLTSGNLQIVLYDLTNMNIYIAYGYMTDDKKVFVEAFDKQFVKLDMKKQFAETM